MTSRIDVLYRVNSDARSIAARAEAIAVEQSVEMPVAAIDDAFVLAETLGRVEDIRDLGEGRFAVRIALSTLTTGLEAGQLLNMLFGNTSIQDDVTLVDAEFPDEVTAAFGGPHHGLAGLRARVGARGALTCTALKPQGSTPEALAAIAARVTEGGIDYIKDDHGLADQSYSPFAERVPRVAEAVAKARGRTPTRYLPSLNGDLDALRRQVALCRACGIDAVLIAPMIAGVAQFRTLVRENPDIAFMAHPTMAGASRIMPSFLLGKFFRLLGADATIFPNHGGRFSYTPEECRKLARFALRDWAGMEACVPVPAGGMSLQRVPELLDFYGRDVMLLIGGSLLATRGRLAEETARYVETVRAAG